MNLLVTGGFGFLGRNIARHFKARGYTVTGLGRDSWQPQEHLAWGFDHWIHGDITLDLLNRQPLVPDLIVHCGGSGSVAFSTTEPFLDFSKTVCSTAATLEYIRTSARAAKLIYPSSPAVHGSHGPSPIMTSAPINPVSPYGRHKRMAEELCEQYRSCFNIDVSIIRFFSIFGNGLRKQLLWDACQKLTSGRKHIEFWGTGDETRDFLHIDDAVDLVYTLAASDKKNLLLNGASGHWHTISEVLKMLAAALKSDAEISFNHNCKPGDPKHYQADISEAEKIPWHSRVSLDTGLKDYAAWFLQDGQQ